MSDASDVQSQSADSRQARLIAAARAQLTDLSGGSGTDDASDSLDAVTKHVLTPDELLGAHIGPYKLLQRLGRGGFGEVYMAEQQTPVRRKVALKIIKPGMDTREVIARFEAERQALALMDHPNIARVFDGGATGSDSPGGAGRPYFVMELVRGVPITKFCDEQRMPIRRRLELFQDVCHAVQHAHQKGIIHRDIKPSNVMVTLHDDKPVPKVIDFGIAKAMQQPLTDKTLFTQYGQFIGTPEYMSPEQAQLNALDVDTRSDVYSLGVLLYELLAGTPPFDSRDLWSAGFDEMRRIIREVEPPRPSTRVATDPPVGSSYFERESRPGDAVAVDDSDPNQALQAETRSTAASDSAWVATHRATDPHALVRSLRGDLDWIVMKCLEKDRQRRYETANGLAMDVARHLADSPVLAAPPSATYRLRKFIRQHRTGVVMGTVVGIALVIGAIGAGGGLMWALRERDRAADEARRADAERIKAQLIAGFIQDTLAGVGPSIAADRDPTILKEMMDAAAARITNGELADAPDAELQLRLLIGDVYREIAEYPSAAGMLEPALQLARRLNRERARVDSPELAMALQFWGAYLVDNGQVPAAEPHLQEALEVQRRLYNGDHADVATSLNQLGWARLSDLSRAAEAEEPLMLALEMRQRLYPGDHADLAVSLNNVGSVRRALGRPDQAEPFYLQALEMRQRLYQGDHPDVANSLHNLAGVRLALGQAAQAEPVFLKAIEVRRRLFKKDHPALANSITGLAVARRALGRTADAEPLLVEALEMRRRLFSADHSDVLNTMHSLALVLGETCRPREAVSMLRELLEKRRRVHGERHADTATTLRTLAKNFRELHACDETLKLFRELLELVRASDMPLHANFAAALGEASWNLEVGGFPADSQALLAEVVELFPSAFPGLDDQFAGQLFFLARAKHAASAPQDAEPNYRKALAIRESRRPTADWITGAFRCWLGRCLSDLGRFDEAEVMLRGAAELLCSPNAFEPSRCQETMQGLTRLYESWHAAEPDNGYDAKAAEWRAKLAEYQASTQSSSQPADVSRAADAP